ncbi:MAG: NUDIX domain-containing protein [Verrucomicrobia bacterium]|nr:NUDIX domain-containing protein [Verrucomicrobiota bacterium]
MVASLEMKALFRHCPRCSSTELEWPDPRHFVCPNCGLTLYRNTTSAVAAFLLDPENNVLLIERAREPSKGMMAVPGGFVDPGERAEEALRREIREEVGLTTDTLDFLCSAPNTYAYKNISYDVLDWFFVGRLQNFDGARPLDEVSGIHVRPLLKIESDSLAFPSLRFALKELQRRLAIG